MKVPCPFTFLGMHSRKSGKRELALAVFVLWASFAIRVFFLVPPEKVGNYSTLLDQVTWPMLGAVFGTFGLHYLTLNRRLTKGGDDGSAQEAGR